MRRQKLVGQWGGQSGACCRRTLAADTLGDNVLLGAAEGAVWAAIGWGASQSPIAKADASPPEGLTRTRIKDAGPFWDWATSAKDLFNSDGSTLSPEFIKRVQPIFDSLSLNVDLSQVRFIFDANGTNLTEGYDIHLAASTMKLDFDDVLGNVLHELGHVVQTVNAPGLGMSAKIGYIEHRDFEERWMFAHMYGDADARYDQDELLRNDTTLQSLSKVHLLTEYSNDAVADRFRDLLLTYTGK